MNILEIIEESILVLRTNKMRTSLSVLGIIIGIGSVISLMTLGQASQESVKKQIQSLGANLIMVRPGAQSEGFLRGGSDSNTLKNTDAEEIAVSQRINSISSVASEYSSRAQISYDRNNQNSQISGITSEYFSLRNIQVEYGSEFSDENISRVDKVAILGSGITEELFGEGVNPVGKTIRIKNTNFEVIGVIKSKGTSGGFSFDDSVFVPLTTAQKLLFGNNYLSTIYVSAKDENSMEAAKNQVGFLLLELHGLKTAEEADFSISSQEDILETVTQVTQTFTTLLTGIAAISLVVGGIGIMNIMLVTVTERTTEVGLRKALGAKSKVIITQFLVESIVLSIAGGFLGVLLGIGVSYFLTKSMSLPYTISYMSVVLAVTVSCVIGIVFGWYPAWKASKLQPIEALRYE